MSEYTKTFKSWDMLTKKEKKFLKKRYHFLIIKEDNKINLVMNINPLVNNEL